MKVSVIIPAYNAASFIAETLSSVLTQDCRDLEVLVINDCSTDSTSLIVERIADQDARVQLFSTAENSGPSGARNLGLNVAKGEWVALLDADDKMSPDRLTILLQLAGAKSADMVSDNLMQIYEDGSQASAPMIPSVMLNSDKKLSFAEFIERNVGSPKYPRVAYGFMKPLIRRDFLEKHAIRYDEAVRFAEDFAFYVQCLAAGANWWITPKAMYLYLVRRNSLTEVQTSADLDRLRKRQRALLSDPKWQALPDLQIALKRHIRTIDRNYYYRSFTDAIKSKQWKNGARLLFDAPDSSSLIIGEIMRQSPTVIRKAICGGYFR